MSHSERPNFGEFASRAQSSISRKDRPAAPQPLKTRRVLNRPCGMPTERAIRERLTTSAEWLSRFRRLLGFPPHLRQWRRTLWRGRWSAGGFASAMRDLSPP